MTYKWKDLVLLFFQGVLIGTGAILPGISGGVLCVAFGIYEPMMAFLSHPISSFKKNYKFLITIILGGGVGFILLAKIVESFLAFSAVAAMFLFCGLMRNGSGADEKIGAGRFGKRMGFFYNRPYRFIHLFQCA